MADFVVGLGSNLGSREAFVLVATRMLGSHPRIEPIALSSRYVSAPLGPRQPDFVNAAVRVRTELAPDALLAQMQRVEASLGRVRVERWGARTVDLDLLWWQGGVVREPSLRVPHPGLLERGFALAPLLDVAPELRGELGAHLDRVGAPPRTPWTAVHRSEGAIEVHALDDADALALALCDLLEGGASRVVHAVAEPSPAALVERVTRLPRHCASVVVESLEAGVIRARWTADAGAPRAPRGAHLDVLGDCRCRLTIDPAKTPAG